MITDLIELRNEASSLGIKNYALLKEDHLKLLIEVFKYFDLIIENNDYKAFQEIEKEFGTLGQSSLSALPIETINGILKIKDKRDKLKHVNIEDSKIVNLHNINIPKKRVKEVKVDKKGKSKNIENNKTTYKKGGYKPIYGGKLFDIGDKIEFYPFRKKDKIKGIIKSIFFDKKDQMEYFYIKGNDGIFYCKSLKSFNE
jgi:hypothetical protein